MSDLQGITMAQMLQTDMVLRIVNRIQTPLSRFQEFFGMRTGDSTNITQQVVGRSASWDIYDSTRRFPNAAAPYSPPHKVRKHPTGVQSAQLMRTHESIMIYDEEVYKTRPLGAPIGSTLDRMGQNHIRRQIQTMTDRFRNQREWMFSRMLRGGFNILPDGTSYKLQEFNAAPVDGSLPIDFQLPSDHTGRLQLGTGADILTDWSNSSADVSGQLDSINKAYTRIHGRALKYIWINSTAFSWLKDNVELQRISGSANHVLLSETQRAGRSREGIQDAGVNVILAALPRYVFIVYDGVLSVDGEIEGTSTTDTSLLVPDNRAIFMPEPDDEWVGGIQGSELVRPMETAQPVEAQGFMSWATPFIDPPGQELKMVDNFLPVMYNPRCIAYGNIGA